MDNRKTAMQVELTKKGMRDYDFFQERKQVVWGT